jgi:hypothetical protein
MADIHDMARQVDWEMEGVRRATQRYQDAAKHADPLTLSPGQKMLREVAPKLIARIDAAKEEVIPERSRPKPWVANLQTFPSEKLAIITLHTALQATGKQSEGRTSSLDGEARCTMAHEAKKLVAYIQAERARDAWVEKEKQNDKAAKARKDEAHKSLLKAFEKAVPTPNGHSWARWSKRVSAAAAEPIDEKMAILLGGALLGYLCEVAPEWFEIASRSLGGGQSQYFMRMTPLAKEMMTDLKERAEVARPRLMPMLIPPNKWKYAA